jgi:hypothetical protein
LDRSHFFHRSLFSNILITCTICPACDECTHLLSLRIHYCYAFTIVTHLLLLRIYYCYAFTIVTHLLSLRIHYCYAFIIVMHLLLLRIHYCYAFIIVTHLLLLRIYYCYAFTIVTHLLLLRIYYCYAFTIVTPFLAIVLKAAKGVFTLCPNIYCPTRNLSFNRAHMLEQTKPSWRKSLPKPNYFKRQTCYPSKHSQT